MSYIPRKGPYWLLQCPETQELCGIFQFKICYVGSAKSLHALSYLGYWGGEYKCNSVLKAPVKFNQTQQQSQHPRNHPPLTSDQGKS